MNTIETIAQRIKRLREKAKLTIPQLASKIEVTRQAVKKWEDGDTQNMKLLNLLKLCSVFEVTAEELITGGTNHTKGSLSIGEPDPPPYLKPHHDRKSVQKVCDLAETISDLGLKHLLIDAEEYAKKYPFTRKQKGAAA